MSPKLEECRQKQGRKKRTIFCLTLFTAFIRPPNEKPSLSLPLSPLSAFFSVFVPLIADESLARRVTRRDPGGSDARGWGVLEEGDARAAAGEGRAGVTGREESASMEWMSARTRRQHLGMSDTFNSVKAEQWRGGCTYCEGGVGHLVGVTERKLQRRMCRRRWQLRIGEESCDATCEEEQASAIWAECLLQQSSWTGRATRCWLGACTR